jgi:hypothetical protein
VDEKQLHVEGDQIIMHVTSMVCNSSSEMANTPVFSDFLSQFIDHLIEQDALVLGALGPQIRTPQGRACFIDVIRGLHKNTLAEVVRLVDGAEVYRDRAQAMLKFVNAFYDYWRAFNRYMVLKSMPGAMAYERRPYRAFNFTVQAFQETVRGLYRDICENISGDHPTVYRQVAAGCNVGLIAVPGEMPLPTAYAVKLYGIPVLRQLLINPPMILNPPMNTRSGRFERVADNPIAQMDLDKARFLCYPIQVGPLVILVYFHERFIGLASSMANLFDLATEEQLSRKPDAVFVYGAPVESLKRFGDLPTVFYDDERNGMLAGFVPLEDRFGYFGYVKKMVLTLHNIVMMKRGRMPFHGAMTRIHLAGGVTKNLLLIGDTATGKSETLEALRLSARSVVRELTVIADDMGSLEITKDGAVLGYGTETGAFIRLDDLQQGYAFGQIDRAIIMSPHQVNARVILPVTTLEEVLHGYPVDMLLYANNFEQVDATHPIIERFDSAERALEVFGEGKSMSKGTTTSKGLTQSYFANIFGPPQYREIHDKLAIETFAAIIDSGAFVGQMRTRLGIPGFESSGPAEASANLLEILKKQGQSQP